MQLFGMFINDWTIVVFFGTAYSPGPGMHFVILKSNKYYYNAYLLLNLALCPNLAADTISASRPASQDDN